jgi:hypothetical protein
MYAWRHVAFVWDLAGIAGTADKMRIYRDGELVASNTDNIADIMVDDGVVKLLGHHEYYRYNQPTAYMDNIKVWDYAKTDFSDRFIEGFSLPPIAEAGGSYTVAEGSSVPLDGAASYVPDPGDVLTYAWDLDGDGVYGETGAGKRGVGRRLPVSVRLRGSWLLELVQLGDQRRSASGYQRLDVRGSQLGHALDPSRRRLRNLGWDQPYWFR